MNVSSYYISCTYCNSNFVYNLNCKAIHWGIENKYTRTYRVATNIFYTAFLQFYLPSFIDVFNFSCDAVISLCNHFIIISLQHLIWSFEQDCFTFSSWPGSIFNRIPISFQSLAWGKIFVIESCIRCPVPINRCYITRIIQAKLRIVIR